MVPWVYPFSTQCQYPQANGQRAILVRIEFASLFDTIYVVSTEGPQVPDSL
jgi:hypothetical protein